MALGGSEQDLNLKVSADTTDATTKLSGLGVSVGNLAKGFVLGNVVMGLATSAYHTLTGVIGDSVRAFNESEKMGAQLNAVLKSTGGAAGMSAKELLDLSQALQKTTTFSDEAVLSAENMLLTFTNITSSVFPQATATVLDMSVALGQDTKNSAIQLGKALNDPILGVTALQRVGVAFSASQKEVIANMVKTGDTLGAQKIILAELTKEFGGSATAQAKTFGGQMEQLKNQVDDVQEGIGHGLTAALNNMFIAFNKTNSVMVNASDVGKMVFKTFSFISEAAASVAFGIRGIASIFVELGGVVAKTVTTITGGGEKSKKFWDDFMQANADGVKASADFALNLHDENQKTLNDWDKLTASSAKVANAGPAAYEATAQSAADAAKKIADANKAVDDTLTKITDLTESYTKSTHDNAKSAAEAYVSQVAKVKELQDQISDPTVKDKNPIIVELYKQQDALKKFSGYAKDHAAEVAEANRRADKTDFERTMDDIAAKQAEEDKTFNKTLARNMQELDAATAKRNALAAGEEALTAKMEEEANKRTAIAVKSSQAQATAVLATLYGDVTKIPGAGAAITAGAASSTPVSKAIPAATSPAPLVFNFNGTVAGDNGIKEIITKTIDSINRGTQLRTFAGTR